MARREGLLTDTVQAQAAATAVVTMLARRVLRAAVSTGRSAAQASA
jgi:hypothetical protein